MVAAVPGEDEVAGQLARRPPGGVHLGCVEDPRGTLDERVGQIGGPSGGCRVVQGGCRHDDGVEGLQRHAEMALTSIGRVGVGDVRGQGILRLDHQCASMLDRGPEFERGVGKGERGVDLIGQRVRLGRGQVPTHPPVHDLRPVGGREVDAIREVPVVEVHPDAERLEDATARVLFARVVPEDAEHADVGLGRDPRARR